MSLFPTGGHDQFLNSPKRPEYKAMKEKGLLMRFYRFGNKCYRHKIPMLPALINRAIRLFFSCDLPVQTQIGSGTSFKHNGLGCVINPESIIGNNVTIYQNVSIAGRRNRGVPIIEDDVFIGCHACILGGVIIGKGAEIGAGAVVLKDIPAGSVAVGVPAQIIKNK